MFGILKCYEEESQACAVCWSIYVVYYSYATLCCWELLLLIELEPVFLSFYYSPYLILQRNNDSLEKWMHQMNTITLLPSYIKFSSWKPIKHKFSINNILIEIYFIFCQKVANNDCVFIILMFGRFLLSHDDSDKYY